MSYFSCKRNSEHKATTSSPLIEIGYFIEYANISLAGKHHDVNSESATNCRTSLQICTSCFQRPLCWDCIIRLGSVLHTRGSGLYSTCTQSTKSDLQLRSDYRSNRFPCGCCNRHGCLPCSSHFILELVRNKAHSRGDLLWNLRIISLPSLINFNCKNQSLTNSSLYDRNSGIRIYRLRVLFIKCYPVLEIPGGKLSDSRHRFIACHVPIPPSCDELINIQHNI